MDVTPVRIDSPSTIVLCPTRTPATSVIAFHFPGGRTPGRTPRSRMRGRSSPARAAPPRVHTVRPAARKKRSRSFASLRMTPGCWDRFLLCLLLILDLVGRRGASRALQVVLHPLHHAEVVIEAVGGQAVAVALPRIEDQADGRLASGFQETVEDERLAGMDARVVLAVEDEEGRARLVEIVNRTALEHQLPVLPRPAARVHEELLVGDVGRAGLAHEVADPDEH